MPCKGYYTGSVYKGLVDGRYIDFPTEEEYLTYIKEREQDAKSEGVRC